MPSLNAAVLEDLDHLHIALVMGIGKLGRWSAFQRAAAADPLGEGDASPYEISAAVDDMASKMEAETQHFDPELPRSFRFLAEATKDPVGVSKAIVYGTVKSAENLLVFLGQRAVGIGKSAINAVEQHISRAVSTGVILTLSAEALRISGALPAGWAWLKPLLDTLAKVSVG